MTPALVLQVVDDQWRSTLIQNECVIALGLDNPLETMTLDSIYRAKVLDTSPVGYFLSPDFFLPSEKALPKLHVGESILVQITREALNDLGEGPRKDFRKRPSVSRRIHLVGRQWIYQPLANTIKPRSSTVNSDEAEVDSLRSLWETAIAAEQKPPALLLKGPTQLERLIRDYAPTHIHVLDHELHMEAKRLCAYYHLPISMTRDPIGRDIDEIWDSLTHPIIALLDGGSLIIEETACATTIDVNLPQLSQSRVLKVVSAVADQIRWRQLCGNIIIDFPISNSDRETRALISSALAQELSTYRPKVSQLNWSKLGWLELRTEVLRPSITQRLMFKRGNR